MATIGSYLAIIAPVIVADPAELVHRFKLKAEPFQDFMSTLVPTVNHSGLSGKRKMII